ncbi:hypothetical protein LEP1GSC020_0585 [Leptospira interrogans serovar Grippotyphosa str. 2006006986]|uniref:LBL_2463 family protein n=1 Tax=Leptospira interrogans TaxID=173 RepID=UPI0002925F4D|nr:hypothetical protein [Leptospira interrogans]EKO87545.1 hypothetical protein LEP1GSC009_2786 [Leptospira interrogans serovar Grippotyphosa str. Andaman]EKP86003.1 hypothetical protein LEP1GSC020_0585 [Leptospira interrogans serovar Grippotyphosa str. 2006006986]EMN54125.1 hypothetical protein LEP1GSC089_0045 [Leptospira interrogans serovar Autumnalis str. LP101]EMN94171.1 hypothetical protein LEP1GSC110_1492 [Leptospira interrogans serovar Medanensis str. UT053]
MTRATNTLCNSEEILEIRDGIQYIGCTYDSNPDLIEHSREFVQLQYSKLGYVGYNPEFDRQFDLNGFSQYYIALNENEEIIATSRIVFRGPFGLPIEYSYREDTGERTIIEDGNIAEMNSFAALSISVGIKVLILSAEYVLKKKFISTYGLYDVERPSIGKLYNRFGAVDSHLHPYKIYFPGYGKYKHGKFKPTEWTIQVSDKSKIIAKISHK